MTGNLILPCLYNAPIVYYSLILHVPDQLLLEQYDHYTKQTYRNRCRIYGANGPIDLSIPVIKDHGKKNFMKDVRIDNESRWNKIHWRSILSAYASAPYFEYMEDAFYPFYGRYYKYLAELNEAMIYATLELLEIDKNITHTEEYQTLPAEEDPREAIHPKKKFSLKSFVFNPVEYYQVFEDKFGFISNLSIMDLLFNEGPNSRTILKESLEIL